MTDTPGPTPSCHFSSVSSADTGTSVSVHDFYEIGHLNGRAYYGVSWKLLPSIQPSSPPRDSLDVCLEGGAVIVRRTLRTRESF